ncbi:hypothetical protein C8R45DRAFT_944652 [Mycena sanguinolenta]|nr:hypothetical protein C8R45DRAFT_944652 [Mycena sanguinolenta]
MYTTQNPCRPLADFALYPSPARVAGSGKACGSTDGVRMKRKDYLERLSQDEDERAVRKGTDQSHLMDSFGAQVMHSSGGENMDRWAGKARRTAPNCDTGSTPSQTLWPAYGCYSAARIVLKEAWAGLKEFEEQEKVCGGLSRNGADSLRALGSGGDEGEKQEGSPATGLRELTASAYPIETAKAQHTYMSLYVYVARHRLPSASLKVVVTTKHINMSSSRKYQTMSTLSEEFDESSLEQKNFPKNFEGVLPELNEDERNIQVEGIRGPTPSGGPGSPILTRIPLVRGDLRRQGCVATGPYYRYSGFTDLKGIVLNATIAFLTALSGKQISTKLLVEKGIAEPKAVEGLDEGVVIVNYRARIGAAITLLKSWPSAPPDNPLLKMLSASGHINPTTELGRLLHQRALIAEIMANPQNRDPKTLAPPHTLTELRLGAIHAFVLFPDNDGTLAYEQAKEVERLLRRVRCCRWSISRVPAAAAADETTLRTRTRAVSPRRLSEEDGNGDEVKQEGEDDEMEKEDDEMEAEEGSTSSTR